MNKITRRKLSFLRTHLEKYFSAETAINSENYIKGSDGHCVMVSMFLEMFYEAKYMSTKLEPISHWFNRIKLENGDLVDVDLTGDQFGHEPVRIVPAGELYSDAV